MRVLRDTSVLVPALVPALSQHEKAFPHLEAAEEAVRLGESEDLKVLQRMTDLGLESEAVDDAVHDYCAEKASADELRTFNGKDFRRRPPEGSTELVVL